MRNAFGRTANAIKFTVEFQEIDKIKEYLFHFAGTGFMIVDADRLTSWRETVLTLHDHMEDEIDVVMNAMPPNYQVFYFDTLKEWLTDWRLASVNIPAMTYLIDEYNKKAYQQFAEEIKHKVDAFRSDPNFSKRKNLEEYEEVDKFSLFGGLFGQTYYPGTKTTKVHHTYYCIEDIPELIDTAYLKNYIPIVEYIIGNFKRIANKYIAMYDADKIASYTQMIHQRNSLAAFEHPEAKLLENNNKELQKIKWKGTAKAFVKAFNPLIKDGTLELNGRSEVETVVKMLYNLFEIDKTKGKGALSLNSLITYFKKENADEPY